MTQEELEQRLDSMGLLSEEQRRKVACVLIGHSRYITAFFGYQYCGRCEDQVGDCLGSMGRKGVNAQHLLWGDCPECEELRPSLDWKDTYMLTAKALEAPFATRADADAGLEAARATMRELADQSKGVGK